MNLRNRSFLLGLAIAVAVALYILISSNPNASESLPEFAIRSSTSMATLSPEEQSKQRELVQKMIQNDEFRPPPGNVGTTPSAVSPFSQVRRASGSEASRNISGNSAPQPGVPQIVPMNIGTQSKQNPVAVATRNNFSVPLPAQANTGTPSTLIEFESPPGIGSAKGGQ